MWPQHDLPTDTKISANFIRLVTLVAKIRSERKSVYKDIRVYPCIVLLHVLCRRHARQICVSATSALETVSCNIRGWFC